MLHATDSWPPLFLFALLFQVIAQCDAGGAKITARCGRNPSCEANLKMRRKSRLPYRIRCWFDTLPEIFLKQK